MVVDLGVESKEPEGYIIAVLEDNSTRWLAQYDRVDKRVWWAPTIIDAACKLIPEQMQDIAGFTHLEYNYGRYHRYNTPMQRFLTGKIKEIKFEPKLELKVYSLALYKVDLAYGGPEEGGWYYDVGEVVDMVEAYQIIPHAWEPIYFVAEEDGAPDTILSIAQERNKFLDVTINKGLPEISSVASQGRYRFCIVEGHPKNYPSIIPHYE